ncbi:hypothetical protein N7486_010684 [Penicillium sp. IBT 16267x]|nr:hypothetical protein N7486_010684 [Penicillium sp. IBT 16267x]
MHQAQPPSLCPFEESLNSLNRKEDNQAPPAFNQIRIFTIADLLKQPFLHELRSVINASYRVHEEGLFKKTGERLTTDTQIATEVGKNGFTGVAWSQNEIVGTISVKKWDFGSSEGVMWKKPGFYAEWRDEDGKTSTQVDDQLDMDFTICDGDFEVLIVAVKPGAKYRKRGISENLLLACEEELKRNRVLDIDGSPRSLRIMLRVVREMNGRYWSKKGFRVVGEKYLPPFTWDLEHGCILWAMRRDLEIPQSIK